MGRLLALFGGSSIGLWIAGGLLAAGVAAWGTQTLRLSAAQRELADARAEWAQQETELASRALEAEKRERAREAQWAKRQQEITDEAIQKLAAADAAASAAAASAAGLRDRVAALASAGRRSCGNPSIATRGAAAPDAIGVLADVLGRADAAAGFMASVADQRGARGEACERAYEALRK